MIDFYRKELESFGKFEQAKSNLKWVINKEIKTSEIENYLNILKRVIEKIEVEGLRTF